MKFKDIPQLTSCSNYKVNVSWGYLKKHLDSLIEDYQLQLDPDFQRAHVWTQEQQIKYVEFILRGGKSAREILINCSFWNDFNNPYHETVLVDGKQRIEAVTRFMSNEIKAFDYYFKDYEDNIRLIGPDFIFMVNNLKTKEQVLIWYLESNSAGTPHTQEELDKVKRMIENVSDRTIL